MKHFLTTLIFALCAVLSMASTTLASPSRFTLIDQSNFETKHGFYVDLENDTGAASQSQLSNLKLYAGVANGKTWIFIPSNITLQTGHQYDVLMTLKSGVVTLNIDSVQQGTADNALAPVSADLTGDFIPGWANSSTNYFVSEQRVTVVQDGDARTLDAPSSAGALFNSTGPGISSPWTYAGGDLTIEVKFELLDSPPSPKGLIDKYGQPTFVDYSGKIHEDSDLTKAVALEQGTDIKWASVSPFNKWGGLTNVSWHGSVTGFYHLAKHNGFSWLIDPSGAPCFYTGIDTSAVPYWEGTPVTGRENLFTWLPGSDPEFADAQGTNNWGSEPGIVYVKFTNANLIRKYGASSWKSDALTARDNRLKAWGFSGVGKWCNLPETKPSTPVLEWNGVPNLIRRPDFFDPGVSAQMAATLKNQITPYINDPRIVGWSLGNEYDQVITTDEIKQILALPAANPSRQALIAYAATWYTPLSVPASPDELERLRQFYADRYYTFVQKTVKSIDPNHLFFGFWLAVGWWQNSSDWTLQSAHVDALGIDVYNQSFNNDLLAPLVAKSTVPIIIGEYSFPPDYSGQRGFGTYGDSVHTDEQYGALYSQWMHDTASNPNVIGNCLFQMYDEPITGRGAGHGSALVYGENYAFGLVRDTDTPKWAILDDVRSANLNADKWRLTASASAKPAR